MLRGIFLLFTAFVLSACAQARLSLPYSPQTTAELDGLIKVGDFGYFPPEGVQQDEIPETAAGRIFLTEPVGQFIANAVRREFRQAGISAKGENICRLEGEVNEFSLDSLGYSTDYASDIRYILYNSAEKALFDNSYRVEFNASKFVAPAIVMANINKVISDNIEQLLQDEFFQKNVNSYCHQK